MCTATDPRSPLSQLGKLYLDQEDFGRLYAIVKELRQSCQNEDGSIDQSRGTQLLDIYALEIQMYTAQKNTKKLKVWRLAAAGQSLERKRKRERDLHVAGFFLFTHPNHHRPFTSAPWRSSLPFRIR